MYFFLKIKTLLKGAKKKNEVTSVYLDLFLDCVLLVYIFIHMYCNFFKHCPCYVF